MTNASDSSLYTLGFSPCPNDTFIFDALVNQKIDTAGIQFEVHLEDVETLNQWAFEGRLAFTKLSYNTILQVSDQYALLDSGSALGRGVGPLMVAKEKIPTEDLSAYFKEARIAIPGKNTTANLLFSLAFPAATHKTEVLFSEIEDRVNAGQFDCGLVIHESRFTYQQKGLHQLIDMGDWWEQHFGTDIPLGGIAVRRDVDETVAKQVEHFIKDSLQYSWANYPVLSAYVQQHAQEMEEAVMRQHIDLYVNDYTKSLGTVGRKAINKLFAESASRGIIPAQEKAIFLS